MIKTEGLNLHTPRSTPQEDLYRQSAEVTTSVANGVVPSPNVCIEWLCREHLKITCLCTLNREHVKTFTSTLNRKHLKIDVLRIGIFSKLHVHLIENISKKKNLKVRWTYYMQWIENILMFGLTINLWYIAEIIFFLSCQEQDNFILKSE